MYPPHGNTPLDRRRACARLHPVETEVAMGQRFVPGLHDPNYQKPKKKNERLSEEDADLLFEAIIAKMDAEERSGRRRN